ncbi:hypothetical protein NDU88_005064 [Pleurodeles waltl]|uniref:Reverse transcriptase n=1 Tax=Pleurodeles waltl TaxID=8319 RepID=A0AAV7LK36_PLEWA|nr:hypothetical protein NDU88_005064 [Pleurodeles waltl]
MLYQDIDQAVDRFTSAVHTAIKGSIPQQTPQHCSIYDFPSGIKHSVAEKNRARRQCQKYRTPDLLKKYNMLTKLLKTQISLHRERNRAHQSFKSNQASKLTVEVEQEITKHYLKHPPKTEAATIEECSSDEIRSLIKKLKNGKAPGKDRITSQAIKMFPRAALDCLAEIFNARLQYQHFPKAWKEARVIVFLKAGKPLRDTANYCPTRLLSGLSKLFKKVILAHLSDFATSENLLAKEQFGFQKEHSTNHQLFRVVDIISHGFNINKPTGVVFLDVAKAFN